MSNNVPKLRFNGFSGDWKCMEVGELCNISTGKKDTQDKTEKGMYPFFVRSQSIERINSYSYDGEAILTAGDGVGVGKVFHYVNCRFDYHQRVYKLSDFNGVNGRFLYEYFSNNFKREVAKYNAKTSVDSVRLEMITKMKIDIPSIEEQKKIASFLTKVDKIIEKQDEKIRNLENYKKGMMQKLFSQEIRFKDENRGEYPEWEEKQLGEISNIGTGNNDLQDKVEGGKYPFYVRSANIERIDKYTFDGEAILIPGDGNIGQIYHYINGKFAYHQRVYKISNFKNNICGKYVYFYMKKFFLKEALKNSVKATVDSLRLPTLIEMSIKVPCLEEQTKIANFFSNIDGIIEKEKEKLEELRLCKKGLLQKMFV